MTVIDSLRLKWQQWTGEEDTPFDADTGAWVASMVFHAALFLVLFFWVTNPVNDQITLEASATPEQEEELIDDLEVDEVVFDVKPADVFGAASLEDVAVAQLQAVNLSEEINIVPMFDQVDVATHNVEVNFDLATAPISGDNNALGATVGEGSTGSEGAVDRLTFEILESLNQRKTLIVWLFDSTLSLKPQRSAIADRFRKIYDELGLLSEKKHDAFTKHDDKPLLTAVVAYGKEVKFLTDEPTDDYAELKSVVESISADSTGIENTFTAVGMSAEKYAIYRTAKNRNVILIAVTDEVGSDENRLDDVLTVTRRYQMPVHVLGVPAPFGRKEVPFRFVNDDPKFEETEYWIPVHQGPESLYPENVNLAFWGSNREQEQFQLIDSGFGPYALTRLTAETGGIYFSIHPNRNGVDRAAGRGGRADTPANATLLYKFWDPAVMRPYQPDYLPRQQYEALVASNQARSALVRAAMQSGADALQNPTTRFMVNATGVVGPEAGEAQQQAARLEPKLAAIHDILKQGEKDRENLTQPRWKAGYDLAMGRVLAAMVRTEGYNYMIAQIKSGKAFQDKKNNTWVLTHSDQINTSSSLLTMGKKAKEFLQRVADEHAGTPWAYLAEKELATPLGWEWVEDFTEPTAPTMRNNNNNPNPNMPADELNKLNRKPNAPRPVL